MKALIISADHFEDTELLVPYYRLKEEGFDVDIASISRGKINGKHGYEVSVDKALRDVHAKDYDILVLPGGKAPAALRKEQAALEIVKDFFAATSRSQPSATVRNYWSRQASSWGDAPPATILSPKN